MPSNDSLDSATIHLRLDTALNKTSANDAGAELRKRLSVNPKIKLDMVMPKMQNGSFLGMLGSGKVIQQKLKITPYLDAAGKNVLAGLNFSKTQHAKVKLKAVLDPASKNVLSGFNFGKTQNAEVRFKAMLDPASLTAMQQQLKSAFGSIGTITVQVAGGAGGSGAAAGGATASTKTSWKKMGKRAYDATLSEERQQPFKERIALSKERMMERNSDFQMAHLKHLQTPEGSDQFRLKHQTAQKNIEGRVAIEQSRLQRTKMFGEMTARRSFTGGVKGLLGHVAGGNPMGAAIQGASMMGGAMAAGDAGMLGMAAPLAAAAIPAAIGAYVGYQYFSPLIGSFNKRLQAYGTIASSGYIAGTNDLTKYAHGIIKNQEVLKAYQTRRKVIAGLTTDPVTGFNYTRFKQKQNIRAMFGSNYIPTSIAAGPTGSAFSQDLMGAGKMLPENAGMQSAVVPGSILGVTQFLKNSIVGQAGVPHSVADNQRANMLAHMVFGGGKGGLSENYYGTTDKSPIPDAMDKQINYQKAKQRIASIKAREDAATAEKELALIQKYTLNSQMNGMIRGLYGIPQQPNYFSSFGGQ